MSVSYEKTGEKRKSRRRENPGRAPSVCLKECGGDRYPPGPTSSALRGLGN